MKKWIIAWRTLRRLPNYSVTALLIPTLGIGATSTLFSLWWRCALVALGMR